MTPKEKALQLIDKLQTAIWEKNGIISKPILKQSAIVTIDAIISEIGLLHKPEYVVFQEKDAEDEWYNGYSRDDYWEEVKKEVEKL